MRMKFNILYLNQSISTSYLPGALYTLLFFYFVDDISHRKFNDQDRYLDAIYKLIIQHEKENKTRRIELCKALLNPIELFCRGIEFLLRFCFAYFLSMIKSDFDYNGKTWRFVVGGIIIH